MTKKHIHIKVGRRIIGPGAPVFIIAEIGTNHNGDAGLALRMIKEAKRAGVDAVKMQIVDAEASYMKGSASYEIFSKMPLPFEELKMLRSEAQKRGLIFFATPGDIPSLEVLLKLRSPAIKISSGSMTNAILLREAGRTGLPVILSTGMAYMDEVKRAVRTLERSGAKEIAVLHCVSNYPPRHDELNLRNIEEMRREFKYPVGYSDHTEGALASYAAVAMGACVIEKHFTLDKRFKGPDHHFSAAPGELRKLVQGIRSIEKMAGCGGKGPTGRELKLRDSIRRSLVFSRDIKKEDILREGDIQAKRLVSGSGVAADRYNEILGAMLKKDVFKDEPVKENLLHKRGRYARTKHTCSSRSSR